MLKATAKTKTVRMSDLLSICNSIFFCYMCVGHINGSSKTRKTKDGPFPSTKPHRAHKCVRVQADILFQNFDTPFWDALGVLIISFSCSILWNAHFNQNTAKNVLEIWGHLGALFYQLYGCFFMRRFVLSLCSFFLIHQFSILFLILN